MWIIYRSLNLPSSFVHYFKGLIPNFFNQRSEDDKDEACCEKDNDHGG